MINTKIFLVFIPSLLLAQAVSTTIVSVNVQPLSQAVPSAKYTKVKLPKGLWAGSVVAENDTKGTVFIGQGSIIKALRNLGLPALSRTDAAAVILHAQNKGPFGFTKNQLPFIDKILNDVDGLVVSKALHVSPQLGIGLAGLSALLNSLTPDILAQIQQFEQTYDSDGLQNLLELGPGQSAVGTVIFDATPSSTVKVPPQSFSIPVPVTQVTGTNPSLIGPQ